MYDKILKKIKPSKIESRNVETKVLKFLKLLNSKLTKAEAIVGGSFAKDTWLKGDHDIDIFVLFNDNKEISKKLEKVLNKLFKKVVRVHGSRDYFQVKKFNLDFEIVPVFKINDSSEAKNITDVSVLHAKWVIANGSSLVDDIRLAKYFCKQNKVYGAETFIKGFSGYVLEILIVYYKGFKNLVKAAKKWRKGCQVDIEKHGTELNISKWSPLIVIDPVQKERNAAAALSLEKFEKFRSICKKVSFEKEKVNLNYNVVLKFEMLKGVKDVVGTKAYKAHEFILKWLDEDYGVKSSHWYPLEGYMCYNLKKKKLGKYRKHYGPLMSDKKHALKFREKHGKVYVEDGRLFVKLEREVADYKGFVNYLCNLSYVKDRVKINRKVFK